MEWLGCRGRGAEIVGNSDGNTGSSPLQGVALAPGSPHAGRGRVEVDGLADRTAEGPAPRLDLGARRRGASRQAGDADATGERVRGGSVRLRPGLRDRRHRPAPLALQEVLPRRAPRGGARASRGARHPHRQPLRPAPLRRRHDRSLAPRGAGPAARAPGARREVGADAPVLLDGDGPPRTGGWNAGQLPPPARGGRGDPRLPGGGARAQQAVVRALPPAAVRARLHAAGAGVRRPHRAGRRGGGRGAGPRARRPPAAGAPLLDAGLPVDPHPAAAAAPRPAPALVRRAAPVRGLAGGRGSGDRREGADRPRRRGRAGREGAGRPPGDLPVTGPGAGGRETVAIAGVAGNLGRALARHLAPSFSLIGIDRRPFPGGPPGGEHWQVDPRKARVEEPFAARSIDALVHMGVVRDRGLPSTEVHDLNAVGTRRLLDLCKRGGVRKVVVLSSASVYGPAPDNSSFLREETPMLAPARRGEMRDLVELDLYAQSFLWRHPEIETVVLRPVNVVGPTVRNVPTRYLRAERPLTALGFDPMMQLIHEEDVCRAIALALRPGVRGVFNLVGPGELPLSAILRELGRRPVPVPHFLLRPVLRSLAGERGGIFPPEEVESLMFACTVDGARAARELGWVPSLTLRDTI